MEPQTETHVIQTAEHNLKAKAIAALAKLSSWKTLVISTYFVFSFNYLFLFICAVIYFHRVTRLNEHCNGNTADQCHADPSCHYKSLREHSCVMGQPDFDFFLFILGSFTLNTVHHLVKTYLALKNLYRHRRANAPQSLRLSLNNAQDAEALESEGRRSTSESAVLGSTSQNNVVGVTVVTEAESNGSGSIVGNRVARSDSFASLPGAINRAETGKYQGYTTSVMCCILPVVWKEWTTEEWGFANRGQSRYILFTDFLLDGLCGFIAAVGYLSLNFISQRVPVFPAVMALLCSMFILAYSGIGLFWARKVRYWGPVVA